MPESTLVFEIPAFAGMTSNNNILFKYKEPIQMKPMIIYNLFPKLAGNFSQWKKHIDRANKMSFTSVYINPIQYPGFSGSCYSLKDYFNIHKEVYADPKSKKSADEQFKEIVEYIHKKKMKIFMDLVINHTAIDSPLTEEHPEWYLKDEKGKIANPMAKDGDKIVAVWGDLAEIDNYNSSDRENLWAYWLKVMQHYLAYGIDGFRCDAAYQVPAELWKFLLKEAKTVNPEVVFLAETLGCPIEDVIKLGETGFEYTFNSSKYWNFSEPWCLQQYEQNLGVSKSISFAESHDTIRLAEEVDGNTASLKQRYIFSAVFSSGVMMPIGYEYGFRKKLDVVKTTTRDWKTTNIDIQEIIKEANLLKSNFSFFQDEHHVKKLHSKNNNILLLLKSDPKTDEKALIILNKDIFNYQRIYINDLTTFFNGAKEIKDISVKFRLDKVNLNFEYNLRPGQVIILYQN